MNEMTTPTTPAADVVSLRFRKKPVVIEASQWFKNGDRPLDYSRGLHLWFASRLDARHTVRRWFGEQRKNMKTPITPQGLQPSPNIDPWDHPELTMRWTAHEIKWIYAYAERYAREALAAQAATLESIHKIIECAGPEAAGEIADLLGYPSVEWPSDQAVSVPVDLWQGRCVYPGGFASEWKEIHPTKDEPTQELRAAYLASLTHPSGEPSYEIRKLYAGAPPPASVAEVDVPLRKVVFSVLEGFTLPQAIRKILEAAYYTPSPAAAAQAVDAVDEPWVVFDSQGYYAWHSTEVSAKAWCEHYNARSADDPLKPYVCRRISECAALQASRQPQPQQAVGDQA